MSINTAKVDASQLPFTSPYLPSSSKIGGHAEFLKQLEEAIGTQPNPYLPTVPVTSPLLTTTEPSPTTPVASPAIPESPAAAPDAPAAETPVNETPVETAPVNPTPEPDPETPVSSTAPAWHRFVFGITTSNNYAGVMVAPRADVPAGYQPGAFRHQLEGFNEAKFDPSHPEGMTLKMIAARIFEQVDVYGPSAIDEIVKAFNDVGIPATKNGLDQVDFGNGEGPIDVIRNAAWLDGDKSAGMAWQWAPVEDGRAPMNFTMQGIALPVPGATASAPSPPVAPIGGAPSEPSPVLLGLGDQLDAGSVEWLHADASSWPVTSKLTNVAIGANSITLDHTKAGDWPVYDFSGIAVEGNPWVFVNRNGQWLGATYDWLRPGQTEKAVTAEDIAANTKAGALKDWRPQPGELVGFMVSTIARNGDRTSNERSDIRLVEWPS